MRQGFLLNQSKFDVLNTFELELPFHETELYSFVECFSGKNAMNFIDKDSLTVEEIKEHHLNLGKWKKQLDDTNSSLSRLFRSNYFVDEDDESTQHRISFQKLILFGIMSCQGSIGEKTGTFYKLLQRVQTVPLKKKAQAKDLFMREDFEYSLIYIMELASISLIKVL